MPEWTLEFDGLFEPRYRAEGFATYGFVARHGDEVVHEGKGVLLGPGEGGSANVAEFGALLAALQWLLDHGGTRGCPLRVTGDSRLVVETVAGRWRLSSERLRPLRDAARALVDELGGATLEKVPREANDRADRLSREAYHEAKREHPGWGRVGGGARGEV